MSAIFSAYNDWLADFCRMDPARLKGIAMINLDDVQNGIKELERAARLGLAGAMITEYPLPAIGGRRPGRSMMSSCVRSTRLRPTCRPLVDGSSLD